MNRTKGRDGMAEQLTGERADLVAELRTQRYNLRHPTRGMTDEQATARTTASELSLGGLIKHVSLTEHQWARFIVEGPAAMDFSGASPGAWQDTFRMVEGETLAGLLDAYDKVAAATDNLVATIPDLDDDQPLPEAPWFPPGARWSARRVVLHIAAETAQHAGHADIIRESIDGAKSMG